MNGGVDVTADFYVNNSANAFVSSMRFGNIV